MIDNENIPLDAKITFLLFGLGTLTACYFKKIY
jgi:hypothetical protein